jgi:hypothetical protein
VSATGRRTLLGALALGGALAGCGGPSADLFEVIRTGDVPRAKLDLIVNDGGTVRCNHGPSRPFPDALLLQARADQEALATPATNHVSLPPGPQPVYRYEVRSVNGSVHFSDDSAHSPSVFHQLAYITLEIAQQACGLPR